MRPFVTCLTASIVILTAATIQSATLNVPGDYPTIQAAIDASLSSDSIMVADGVYTGPGNTEIELRGKLVVIASENGP